MKVKAEMRDDKIIGYWVKSPATGNDVLFWTKDGNPNVNWDFNGDFEKPTFTPSMLMTYPEECAERGYVREHFFVTYGKIHYLSDCRHAYAGKIVDMVDL